MRRDRTRQVERSSVSEMGIEGSRKVICDWCQKFGGKNFDGKMS